MKRIPGPLVLIINDGWGISEEHEHNAIAQAKIPFFRQLLKFCPNSQLQASGTAVGLPEGFMGNSEVGHLNLGAGRVVKQMITRIDDAINDKSFYSNEALLKAVGYAKQQGGVLHIMGIFQESGVHSHIGHFEALIKLAKVHEVQIAIHVFSDGRDGPEKQVLEFIERADKVIGDYPHATYATLIGRFFACDRDKRWDRIQKAYECLTYGTGRRAHTIKEAVHQAYEHNETDEFIKPTIIDGYKGMTSKDAIIFFNFRLDRARQLTQAFVDPNFSAFRQKKFKPAFVAMTQYYHDIGQHALVAFPNPIMKGLLGHELSKNYYKQLRIAETEKYAHVTYFFNGQVEEPFVGEERILVPSPKVKTYDKTPEMSASKIVEKLLPVMQRYDVIILNFANADMVGHTGDLKATIKAVEILDGCMQKILTRVKELNGVAIITSDHGNAEIMVDKEGELSKHHSTSNVPFIVFNYECTVKDGKLADVAPTILHILGLHMPKEMTGDVLL